MVKQKTKNQVKQRDGKCVECGSLKELTVDHIIPLSRGGLNTPDNLRTLCGQCNRRKGNRIEWDFMERISMALHVDEITTNLRNEMKTNFLQVRSDLNSKVGDMKSWTGDRFSIEIKKRDEDIAFLKARIASLEEHLKLEWYEETTVSKGFRKKK